MGQISIEDYELIVEYECRICV